MNYDNVEIIDIASSDFKLRMKELLCILARKPELNKLTVQVWGEYNTHHEVPTTSTNKKVMRLATTYN